MRPRISRRGMRGAFAESDRSRRTLDDDSLDALESLDAPDRFATTVGALAAHADRSAR